LALAAGARDTALHPLPPVDRLDVLAFDARLSGTPEPLLQAIWAAAERCSQRGVFRFDVLSE
jgi:hypothetical protein